MKISYVRQHRKSPGQHRPGAWRRMARVATVASALGLAAHACSATAATLTYDSNGSTTPNPSNGDGYWLEGTNWWNGTTNVGWNSSAPDNAILGTGTGGSANFNAYLSANATVGTITFANHRYNIIGTGTLTIATGITANSGGRIAVKTVLNNSSTWSVASGQTLQVDETISGTGTLIKTGQGTLYLDHDIAIGTTRLEAGTLMISGGALRDSTLDTATGAGTLAFDSANLVILGALTGAGNIELKYQTFNKDLQVGQNNSTQTYSGVISGAGSVTKMGTGGWTLTNINTYTGKTQITAGTLTLGHAQALQNSTVDLHSGDTGTLSFGTLTAATIGNLTGHRALNLENDSGAPVTLSVGGNNESQMFSGSLTGTGNIIKTGTGSLTLINSPTTFTGTTRIASGSLQVAHELALQYSTLDMNANDSGTFSLYSSIRATLGNLTGSRDLAFDWAYLAIGGNNTNQTYSGVISGLTYLTKIGTGSLTLAGANTTTADTQVSAGQLILDNPLALQASTVILAAGETGTLGFGSITQASLAGLNGARGILLQNASAAPVALTVGSKNSTETFSGDLTGSGSFTKVGTGVLTLGGNNTFTGGTTIAGGTLSISATANLGGPLTLAGGMLQVTGTAVSHLDGHPVNVTAAGGTVQVSQVTGSVAINQAITGAGLLTKSGAGRLVLTTANSNTGGINVTGGLLVATHASALNPTSGGAVTIRSGAGLHYRAATDTPLILPTTLSITGGTGTSLGATLGATATSARIIVNGAAQATGPVRVDFHRLGAFAEGTYTLIEGGAGSSLNGASYLINGTTNFTAAFLASPTALQVTFANATPLSSAYWKGGLGGAANVWATSNGSTASNWTSSLGGADQPLVPSAGTDVYFSGTAATLAPTSTLLGIDMSVRSLTILDGLGLGADGSTLTIGAGGVTVNAAALGGSIAPNVIMGANQTWTNHSYTALTMSGILSGAANFTKSGIGTVTLSGINTFTGAITINAGQLAITSDTNLGDTSNNITINSGGVLHFGSAVSLAAGRTIAITGTAGNPSGLNITSNLTQVLGANQLTGSGVLRVSTTGPTIQTAFLSIEGANSGFTGAVIVGAGGQFLGTQYVDRASALNYYPVTLQLKNAGQLTGASSFTFTPGSGLTIAQSDSAITGRIASTAPLTFQTGRFQYQSSANGGAAINDTFGPVGISGQWTISGSPTAGPTAGTTLNFGNLTRQDRATVVFSGPAIGTQGSFGGPVSATSQRIYFANLTPDTVTSGTTRSIVPWAANAPLLGGTDVATFMTYDADGFRPLSATEILTVATNGLAAAPAGTNISTSVSQTIATGGQTINSYASLVTSTVTGSATLSAPGDVLTITSGGIAATNNLTFNNATINFPNGGYFFPDGLVSVSGSSRITGTDGIVASSVFVGRLILTNTPTGGNTFTGGLYANGNVYIQFTLNNQLGNDANGLAAGDIVLGGGQLQYTPTSGTASLSDGAASRAIRVNASGGTIVSAGTAVLQIPGAISGVGQVQFGSTGLSNAVVELTNPSANTYTGGTVILNGYLRISNANQLGTGPIAMNGGVLQASSALNFTTGLTLASSSSIDSQAYDVTLGAPVTGAGGLTKLGSGRVLLSAANTYTGVTTITQGSLVLTATGSLADTSNLTVNGATAVFNLGADRNETVGTVTLQGGGSITGTGTSTLTVNADQTFALQNGTVSARLSGAAALNKTTTGTVTLAGANTYTGATTVTAGRLVVSGSISGSTTTVAATGTLAVTGRLTTSADVTISGTLTGGSVDGLNGKIEGTGTGGRVVVNSGGHVSPGASTNGLTDTAILSAKAFSSSTGAHLDIQLGGTTAGTQYDKIVVDSSSLLAIDLNSGNSGGGTTLNLTLLSYVYNYGDKFFIVENVNAAGSVHGLFANAVIGGGGAGFDTITAGGITFAVGYSGNAATNSFTGGNDVVLMAVPEPNTSLILATAFSAVLGLQRFRRRR